MTTYDAKECERLCREAIAYSEAARIKGYYAIADHTSAMADQLEAAGSQLEVTRKTLEREISMHAATAGQLLQTETERDQLRAEVEVWKREAKALADANHALRLEASEECAGLRAEVERMRPVVEAAERYADNGACYAGIMPAVDAYRAARDQASPTPRETSASIAAWADETFGVPGSNISILYRAGRELTELEHKLMEHDSHPSAAEECADVVIVLARMVHRLGKNLQSEIDRKMAINRARKWTLTGDGHGQHVIDRAVRDKAGENDG